MRVHEDARRRFIADLFPTAGDVNVVYLHSPDPIAWHRHQKQTDFIYCIWGRLRVCLVRPGSKDVAVYGLTGADDPLEIPPDTWHGYEPLSAQVILVSYLSRKYDPTDEERAPLDAFPWPTTTA
jgi:dTDP-4-dehydrorhamnose 3,5-epimerase-like enzyme